MATLIKLQISGIRSYGPHDNQVQTISFKHGPVTLILGQNGCGKTTIIEALRFALTGDVPGSIGMGQSFVNDPKMTNSMICRGQIKLEFKDVRNSEVVVSRVVNVIRSRNTLKFSCRKPSLKTFRADGTENNISSRCTDVNFECCQLMNVSPAIINNVIFCHQENSLWPLDDGKKLKDKFDEIFGSQNYIRCVEEFRKAIKITVDKLKNLRLHLSYKEEKKEIADKKQTILQDKIGKLEGFNRDITTKKVELNTMKEHMKEIYTLEQNLADLQKNLEIKEATKKTIIEEQNIIKRGLAFEFEGSDEELRGRIERFEKDTQKQQSLIADLEARKSDIEAKSRVLTKTTENAITHLGSMKEQKKQYEKRCEERTTLIGDAKNILNLELNGFEDNDGARRIVHELKMVQENQKKSFASLIEEKNHQQKQLQEFIDTARERAVSAKQNLMSKEKEIEQSEKKLKEVVRELSSRSTSDTVLNDLKNRIDNIDRTVQKLSDTVKEQEEIRKVETYKHNIQVKENKLESLTSEYRILQLNDVTEGKIESDKRQIIEKQEEIDRIKKKHSYNFRELFDGAIPERNLKEAVLAKLKSVDLIIKNLTNEITLKQKEVTTLEVQRNNQREKISSCENELKFNRDKLSKACNGRDFNEVLNSTFINKERLLVDKGQYNSMNNIYGEYIKKFEEQNPCCPVCETDFKNKTNVVQTIISTLKIKLNQVSQELSRAEIELEKEKELYNNLQHLKLVNDQSETLAKEKLPELQKQLEGILEQLGKKMSELNALKMGLVYPQKVVDIANSVIFEMVSLDQNIADVDKSQRTIEELKKNLVEVASKKSKHQVEAEIDNIKLEVSELRDKIETTTKDINNHKDRIQQLLEERKNTVDRHVALQDTVQSKSLLEQQQIELDNKVAALKDEVETLRAELSMKQEELERATTTKENVALQSKQQVDDQHMLINTFDKTVEHILKLQQEIDGYLNNKVDQKSNCLEEKLREYRDTESALKTAKSKVLDAISEAKENTAKEELTFRTLQNNVILREKKSIENKLGAEIQALKNRMGEYHYRKVFEEMQNLEKLHMNLDREISNLEGEEMGLADSIRELREELDRPDLKNAHANYMEKLYEVKLSEIVIKDVQKYLKALEKCLLDSRRSKIAQINRSIRHMWRNTYRGNDIDYIEIKTELGNTSHLNQRAYNYKVVQIKKGIEVDMKDRCSAGQKVLACLIIRMAMAEISNCGILALDEPTTNLDRANMLSLADMLVAFIASRRKEKNFQLLVITHDADFLNILTRAEGIPLYYNIKRDAEGFSLITEEQV